MLPQLTGLNLAGCKNSVTDGTLDLLSDGGNAWRDAGREMLTNVYLDKCGAISLVGMKMFVKGYPALHMLSLRSCFQVNDGWVKMIAEGLRGLTVLSLEKCSRVTDVGVGAFAKQRHAVLLTTLDVRNCARITAVSLEALAAVCKDLRCLKVAKCKPLLTYRANNPASLLVDRGLLDFTDAD
jgi:F-box/leucine-rich repeat protein 2/20